MYVLILLRLATIFLFIWCIYSINMVLIFLNTSLLLFQLDIWFDDRNIRIKDVRLIPRKSGNKECSVWVSEVWLIHPLLHHTCRGMVVSHCVTVLKATFVISRTSGHSSGVVKETVSETGALNSDCLARRKEMCFLCLTFIKCIVCKLVSCYAGSRGAAFAFVEFHSVQASADWMNKQQVDLWERVSVLTTLSFLPPSILLLLVWYTVTKQLLPIFAFLWWNLVALCQHPIASPSICF